MFSMDECRIPWIFVKQSHDSFIPIRTDEARRFTSSICESMVKGYTSSTRSIKIGIAIKYLKPT